MRILSQDGMIDVPYDTTSLSVWDNHDSEFRKFRIYAHMRNQNGSPCILAIYSTEAKAKRAMEMLHEEVVGIPDLRRTEDLCGRLKYQGRTDIQLFLEHILIKKHYFQFPADDELEGV